MAHELPQSMPQSIRDERVRTNPNFHVSDEVPEQAKGRCVYIFLQGATSEIFGPGMADGFAWEVIYAWCPAVPTEQEIRRAARRVLSTPGLLVQMLSEVDPQTGDWKYRTALEVIGDMAIVRDAAEVYAEEHYSDLTRSWWEVSE